MSSSFASLVAACCLLAVAVSGKRSIVSGPLNDAFEYGPATQLNCEASGPGERVQWAEFATNPDGAIISDNDLLLPGHPNFARYTLDHPEGSTVYNLGISPTVLGDAGVFRCQDVSDASTGTFAQLVLLEGAPNCTTNIPENGHVREDQYYTIECILGYRGNVPPKMTWTGPDFEWGNWGQATATSNVSVWSGVNMNMSRFFSDMTFSLLINFTEEGFIAENFASNVPTWNFTYETAPLFVQWAPKNMYRVPEQDTYEIGDRIECWADANPSATYYWQNLDTLETWEGQVLTATEQLVGSWRMRCHAENTINDAIYPNDYFFNFTVNPRTTTPEPTTPTTTTPPPAEAPCDDLTGRWGATSPTVVDMCLEIDNTKNGRIVGLFRNATDPYFIEIRGRAAPYQYNQVGFTGVWPVNIGSLAFNGICRKCFGVEILEVTGIGRKVTDNPTCQDPGQYYTFADYAFRRTGAPCRSLFAEYNIKF